MRFFVQTMVISWCQAGFNYAWKKSRPQSNQIVLRSDEEAKDGMHVQPKKNHSWVVEEHYIILRSIT